MNKVSNPVRLSFFTRILSRGLQQIPTDQKGVKEELARIKAYKAARRTERMRDATIGGEKAL